MTILLLLIAGAVGGFVAGLVGVGGGIIFGPVLFFYFQALGITDPVLTPLTLGSSLLCTGAASISGAIAQQKAGAIDWRTAGIAGSFAAVAVTLMTLFVTTQPWYDKTVFQAVLGTILVVVIARMLIKKSSGGNTLSTEGAQRHLGFVAGIGGTAGTVAAAAGVGGGVIMVPAFNGLVRLPLKVAAGTSTAAIVLIAATGVLVYTLRGLSADVPAGSLGYVDWLHAAALAGPALITARLGVQTAHRIDVRWVRYSFAAFAAVVAVRLLWNAFAA